MDLSKIRISSVKEYAELTGRQKDFVVEFLMCGVASEAARKAGYAEKVCGNAASTVMTDRVRKAIDAVRDKYFSQTILSKNEALSLLTEYARGNFADLLDANGDVDGSRVKSAGRVVENYTVVEGKHATSRNVKLRDPIAAIEKLAKLLHWTDDDTKLNVGNMNFELHYHGKEA